MHETDIGRGVTVTSLGLGGSQFGNLGRVTTDEQCADAVATAWAQGIRYFDTAPHYGLGLSEKRLGALLGGYRREDVTVSTKVGRLLIPTPDRASATDDGFAVPATHRRQFDFSRDGILRSLEESLARLGMDYVDIAYLHDPDDHWEAASTTGIGALIELRDQGVVRAVGAGMNQSAMLADFVERCDVDIVMLAGRYTLVDRRAAADLLPLAHERGVAVAAAGVYNSGLLSRQEVPADAIFEYEAAPLELVARARAIASVCAAHGVELPDAATQFPTRAAAVACVVVGVRDGSQVEQAIARSRKLIPQNVWAEIYELVSEA
jgi:D-threo-aldose 1-dehydrogenase